MDPKKKPQDDEPKKPIIVLEEVTEDTGYLYGGEVVEISINRPTKK